MSSRQRLWSQYQILSNHGNMAATNQKSYNFNPICLDFFIVKSKKILDHDLMCLEQHDHDWNFPWALTF